MDNHFMDPLKEFASRTAQLLNAEQDGNTVEVLRRFGLMKTPEDSQKTLAMLAGMGLGPERLPSKEGWVGIWQPKVVDGKKSFVRSSEWLDEWGLWANLPTIAAKSAKKRVVFLGESVARGFHYDPRFTPAEVLETMLAHMQVPDGAEVIDLARTSLESRQLLELLRSSVLLEPDMVVILAGNNWVEDSRPWQHLEQYTAANILRERGVPGFRDYLEQRLKTFTENLVSKIVAFHKETDIPVVFMLPEFNIGDWDYEEPYQAPWMSGQKNVRWLQCFSEAKQALATDRVDEAEKLATEMVELDQGTAGAGFTLLAKCTQQRGASGEARVFLERLRDAHNWNVGQQTPRCPAVVEQVLRSSAAREEIHLVDLPAVFAEWLDGEPADRRLFLDYCHFSSEGIVAAMAATAELIGPLLGGAELKRDALSRVETGLDGSVESEAHFAAAIHNAHWGQSYDIVHYHCSKAVEASGEIAAVMLRFIDMQARRAPMWMCEATEKMSGLSTEALRRYLLNVSTAPMSKLFDRVLLDAMAAALDHAGIEAGKGLQEIRLTEHGVEAGKPRNLLDPIYAPSWFHFDWWPWAGPLAESYRYHYYKAYSPVSRFEFVARSGQPLSLRLTCRRRGAATSSGEACRVRINGASAEQTWICLSEHWITSEIRISGDGVRDGVNEVEVLWPSSGLCHESGIEEAAREIELGGIPCLFPVFGHIHSFVASVPGGAEAALSASQRPSLGAANAGEEGYEELEL